MQTEDGTQDAMFTCADEGWNSVQYSFVMQLCADESNLCKCGMKHVQLCNLCKWGVEHVY